MGQDAQEKLKSYICWDIAVVVKDLDSTVKRLEELGFGPFVIPDAPPGAEGLYYQDKPLSSDYKALAGRIGNMQIEIIQPDDKPNPWKEFLDTRGEGIHHIGFQIDNVEKEIDRMTERGAEVQFYGKINGKTGAAYMDLKTANIVLELTSFNDIAGK